MRVADLFCGAGGSAMGLHRLGFDVVGFDIKPQPRYPFEFHQTDAFTVDLSRFDAIWASPPCQFFVDSAVKRGRQDLVTPTRSLLIASGLPYIIENVDRAPLQNWVMLCGTMFGLPLIRHRLFECSWGIPMAPASCNHWGSVADGTFAGVYGHTAKGHRRGRDKDGKRIRDPRCKIPDGMTQLQWWSKAMGIDWMAESDLHEAIPPAYSEYVGRYLLDHLNERRRHGSPDVLGK